jgi:small subunit ribosomal protein S8
MAKKENVNIPLSNMVKAVLEILKKQDYIENYKLIDDKKQGEARVYLKYIAGKPAIRGLKKISRPGLRKYVEGDKVPRVLRGRGLAILSTSKGIITDTEARQLNVGGEVLCYVW